MLITIKSAEAVQRPLAGIGVGAHLRDGLVDSAVDVASVPGMGVPMGIEATVALALPRVKPASAATNDWQVATAARDAGGQVSTSAPTSIQAKTAHLNTQQFKVPQSNAPQHNYATRVNPVFRGGVGPHPAREPEPV
jgi:hypothetical protein